MGSIHFLVNVCRAFSKNQAFMLSMHSVGAALHTRPQDSAAAFNIDSKDVHTYDRNCYDLTTNFPTPVKARYQEPTYVMLVDKK